MQLLESNSMERMLAVLVASGLVLGVYASVRNEPPQLPVPAIDQSSVGARGYVYVGGSYGGDPGNEIMQGQMSVEVVAPKHVRRPYPLVLIHSAGQRATN